MTRQVFYHCSTVRHKWSFWLGVGGFCKFSKRKKFFFVSLSNRNCNFPHLTSRLFRLLFAKGRSDGTFETCNNVFFEVKGIVEGGSKVENCQGGEWLRWRMIEVEND